MAFLPERNFFEETIANAYDLSSGVSIFPSSDISKFNIVSLQFIYLGCSGLNEFTIEQSNDNVNWSTLSDEYDIPVGSGNFIIDKATFTGKYIRVCFVTADTGIISIKLLAKR